MNLPVFDWQEGTASIEWTAPTSGLIRFHYEGNHKFPYRGVCTVKVGNGGYEFKGMVFRHESDAPTREEHRAVKNYLKSMGLIGISRRLKDGKVIVKNYR